MRKKTFPWHWIVLALLAIVCVTLWILGPGKISTVRNAEEPQNNQSWEEAFDESMRKLELPQWNAPIEGKSSTLEGTNMTIDKEALHERGAAVFDEKLPEYADHQSRRQWTIGEMTERWWQESKIPFGEPSLFLEQLRAGTGTSAVDTHTGGILRLNKDFSALYTTINNRTMTGSWSLDIIDAHYQGQQTAFLLLSLPQGDVRYRISSSSELDEKNRFYRPDLFLTAEQATLPDYMIVNPDISNKIPLRIDSASYNVINDYFFRDSHAVYFNGSYGAIERMPTFQPSSFHILSDTFAADNERIYAIVPGYEWVSIGEVAGADPQSFKVLSSKIGKDDSHVYFYTNRIEGADPSTFTMVKGYEEFFSQDKNHLYLIDVPLENAQPSSFTITEVTKEGESEYTDFVKWTITNKAGKHAIVRLECGGPGCYYPEIFVIVPVDPDAKTLTYQGMDESGSGMTFLLEDDRFRYSALIPAKQGEEEYYRISVHQPTNIRREPLPVK